MYVASRHSDSRDFVTVFADSRIRMPEGRFDDNRCKLVAEDNHFVFFASNWTSNKIPSYSWTAEAEAREVWRKNRASNSIDLVGVATDWAQSVEARYAHEHELSPDFLVGYKKPVPHGILTMITGIFFLGAEGQIRVVEVRVEFDSNLYATADRTLRMSHVVRELNLDEHNFGAYGITDIANEYGTEVSERSRVEMQSFWKGLEGKSASARQQEFLNHMGELTLRLSKNKDAVGKPFNVLRLYRDGKIKWLERTTCK